MFIDNFSFTRNDISCYGTGDQFEDSDLKDINKIYFAWKDLNEAYTNYNMRRANLPEILSEGLTSVLFGWVRTNGTSIHGLESSSCDLIDIDNCETIQLKACSTDATHNPGPTSFGPRTEFDKLIFMHVDCATDTANWYLLDSEEYAQWKVNRTETIADQQAQGRRPRLTILPRIKENNLTPIKTYTFQR